MLIVTDGEENSSHEFTLAHVKKLITKKEAQDGWNFVYLGANQDAFAVGAAMGVAQGATANYTASHVGTKSAFSSLTANTAAYRSHGGRGQSVSASYFVSAGRPVLDGEQSAVTIPLQTVVTAGKLVPTDLQPEQPAPVSGRLQPAS